MVLGEAVFWVFGVFAIGVIGFFVVAAAMIFSALGALLRMITGGRTAARRGAVPRDRAAICRHTTCGHVNPAEARYCARCGARLPQERSWDSYG